MALMGLPLWAWIVFYVLVLLMLVADLKMFGKKGQHEVLFWGIFCVLVLSMLLSVVITRNNKENALKK